jgi:hypothetical protein
MKRLLLLVLLAGCHQQPTAFKLDPARVTSAKVTYTAGLEQEGKVMLATVDLGQAEARELAESLHVVDIEPGLHLAKHAYARVEFILKDDSKVHVRWLDKAELGTLAGLVHVDIDFYRKANELASRRAGKAIDVLAEN